MAKFRKKPVVIDAVRYDGQNHDEIEAFYGQHIEWKTSCPMMGCIKTLEGHMLLRSGAWLIKGVKGEFYPIDPEIFETSYEPAE